MSMDRKSIDRETKLKNAKISEELQEKFENFQNMQADFQKFEDADRMSNPMEKKSKYRIDRGALQEKLDDELIKQLKSLCRENIKMREEILQIHTLVAKISNKGLSCKGTRNPYAVEEID